MSQLTQVSIFQVQNLFISNGVLLSNAVGGGTADRLADVLLFRFLDLSGIRLTLCFAELGREPLGVAVHPFVGSHWVSAPALEKGRRLRSNTTHYFFCLGTTNLWEIDIVFITVNPPLPIVVILSIDSVV